MTRRDNGLPGGEWRRLADLAPPVADHVLEVLADEGIAAYAAPATGLSGPYLETRAHPRPLDQVFVGSNDVDRAREVLDRLLPELHSELADARDEDRVGVGRAAGGATDEDVWAGIVAAYSAPPAEPVGRWSAAEETDPPVGPAADPAASAAASGSGTDATADPESGPGELGADTAPVDNSRRAGQATGFDDIRAELDALGSTPASGPGASGPAEDPTDHYVPPPPPPLPEGDTVTRTAWICLIGGPLYFIVATLLGWGAGGFTGLLAVLAFVGGFITLVTRMRDEPPDDGDDGAVV